MKTTLNEDWILITGFRLLKILELLNKKDAKKSEIKEYLKNILNKEVSDETLKLDINTLINSGFEIKRKHIDKQTHYCLSNKVKMFKLTKEETFILDSIKNASFDFLEWKKILFLKEFYKRIFEFAQDKRDLFIGDFDFFDSVNMGLVDKIEEGINKKLYCYILYNSYNNGIKEALVIPIQIIIRNHKLYMDYIKDDSKEVFTLRFDNIKSAKITDIDASLEIKKIKKSVKYNVKKSYFENNPMENSEKVLKKTALVYEIETLEKHDFFLVQRLLTLGKNCTKISDSKIKNKITDILKETLEAYK